MSEPLIVALFEALRALEIDVNGYVRKPITKDSPIRAVHRAFNRSPDLKAPELYAALAMPTQA